TFAASSEQPTANWHPEFLGEHRSARSLPPCGQQTNYRRQFDLRRGALQHKYSWARNRNNERAPGTTILPARAKNRHCHHLLPAPTSIQPLLPEKDLWRTT